MAQGSFSAQISAWGTKAKAMLHAVRADAVQDMVAVMQTPGPSVANPGGGAGGNMPVASGFLRASLVASPGYDVPAATANPNPDGKFSYDGAQINLVIQGADFETPITFAYTAVYARKMEERYAFARLATQRWGQFVSASAAKAEALVTSSQQG
ncbi:hypothetical protein [Brevundimonas sp. FT23028]|uniref:hypothetical protein n=1 Tax=Brevundimonas sp. FT23028 TaxID=3393748 RepID=UPI003B58ACE8